MVIYAFVPNDGGVNHEGEPQSSAVRMFVFGAGDAIKSPALIPNQGILDRYDIGSYNPTYEFLSVSMAHYRSEDPISVDPLMCYITDHPAEYISLLDEIARVVKDCQAKCPELPTALVDGTNMLSIYPSRAYLHSNNTSSCPVGVISVCGSITRVSTIFGLLSELNDHGAEPIDLLTIAEAHILEVDRLSNVFGLSAVIYWNTTDSKINTIMVRLTYNAKNERGGTYQSIKSIIRVRTDEVD